MHTAALVGPRVALVAVASEHRAELRRIHATPEVSAWWKLPAEDWPGDDPDARPLTVLGPPDDDGERPVIGFVEWSAETDPDYRHAGIDLFLDPARHGQGLGTEVLQVLCAHLVDHHGFCRITIDPAAHNAVAIASYRKVGFRPVGVLRRYERAADGSWHDGLLMDLLAEELVRAQPVPPELLHLTGGH